MVIKCFCEEYSPVNVERPECGTGCASGPLKLDMLWAVSESSPDFPPQRKGVISAYVHIRPWPDVSETGETAGYKTSAFLCRLPSVLCLPDSMPLL